MRIAYAKNLDEVINIIQQFSNELYLNLLRIREENDFFKFINSDDFEVYTDLPFFDFYCDYDLVQDDRNEWVLTARNPLVQFNIITFDILPLKTKRLGHYKISMTLEYLLQRSSKLVIEPVNILVHLLYMGTHYIVDKRFIGNIELYYDNDDRRYKLNIPIYDLKIIDELKRYKNEEENRLHLEFLLKLKNVSNIDSVNSKILERGLTILYDVKTTREMLELFNVLNSDATINSIKDIFGDSFDVIIRALIGGGIIMEIRSRRDYYHDNYAYESNIRIAFNKI
jgi:hypothetical protein